MCLILCFRGASRWVLLPLDRARLVVSHCFQSKTNPTGCWLQLYICCTNIRTVSTFPSNPRVRVFPKILSFNLQHFALLEECEFDRNSWKPNIHPEMSSFFYMNDCSSLEMIVGLESNSKIFTVSVQGLLELQVSGTLRQTHASITYQYLWNLSASMFFFSFLQAGQYTSIFVDNAAGASITIQNGSDFMGMLLGV